MNYSRGHKGFVYWLNRNHNINEQDVLDHPENYLGPNYKEVLNLWFFWDSLSDEQRRVYWKRREKLGYETTHKAWETAGELSKEIIDSRAASQFLWIVPLELVAAHLYIERNIPFTYLPLIFDL